MLLNRITAQTSNTCGVLVALLDWKVTTSIINSTQYFRGQTVKTGRQINSFFYITTHQTLLIVNLGGLISIRHPQNDSIIVQHLDFIVYIPLRRNYDGTLNSKTLTGVSIVSSELLS